jgi:hypothetical protein
MQILSAQTKDAPNSIGLFGVKTEYIGDLGNNVFKFGDDFRGGVGLSFDRYLSRFFDMGIYGSFSSTGIDRGITTYSNFDAWKNRKELENEVQNFRVNRLTNFHLHGRFKILNSERWRLIPYVGVAGGTAFYQGIQTNYLDDFGNRHTMPFFDLTTNDFKPNNSTRIVSLQQRGIGYAWTLGGIVGMDYRVSRNFSVRYQAVGSWTSCDDFDFLAKGGNDWQIQHNIGLVYRFSGKKPVIPPPPPPPPLSLPPHIPVFLLSVLPKFTITERIVEPPVVAKKDTAFFFPSIQLAFGEATLDSKTEIQLDSIADWLIINQDYRVIISGHADTSGCAIYNQQLSDRRAAVVERYLIAKGVVQSRITARGYGDTAPIGDNRTPEGRVRNRRVEIEVRIGE